MQLLKASSPAISTYLSHIADYDARAVAHETGRRFAFQRLLEETCKVAGWAVTAEETINIGGKTTIRPDAILERNAIPRGYWEAKDHGDDLEVEIRKKIAAGYPTNNIIFEDTRRAVLFQNHARAAEYDLSQPTQIADLLNAFYSHSEPDFVSFDQALQGFKERVGELASGLKTRIDREYRESGAFHSALDKFLDLCKRAIGEKIDQGEVITMLIQHLLTERLIRKLFNNPDFARRNAIAAEIETVIDALTSHSFSREEYLKDLGRYYEAIEGAAHGLDFNQKQKVLNEVYEVFFKAYAPEQADVNGIVYTPRPIVDFMCDSVIQVLDSEFGLKLDSPEVVLLDPATGTGNFVVQLIHRLPKTSLPEVYANRLFANEIMLMPYYIASLNIEHAYFDKVGDYKAFEGLCYVDTLSLEHGAQPKLFGLSERNDERIARQGAAPVTVIIGNPPYNVGQKSENDNNKNKPYPVLDKRIRETYVKDSAATNKNSLYDAYVRFFRWAADRLQGRDGIVCYVSNNNFADQLSFDGMRKHLLQDFSQIYHIDLHGNVRQNPKLSGTTHNVFGIQVGVGITVAVKHISHTERRVFYTRVPEDWRKEQKLDWLREQHDISQITWQSLIPDAKNRWLVTKGADEFGSFMPMSDKTLNGIEPAMIFRKSSNGIKTNRDDVVYDFHRQTLIDRIEPFVEAYNAEVDRYKRAKAKNGTVDIDKFVDYRQIKWDSTLKSHLKREAYGTFDPTLMRVGSYRPFTRCWLYFDHHFINTIALQHYIFPITETEKENRAICVSGPGHDVFYTLCTDKLVELKFSNSSNGGTQCFPFYTYDEDGGNRRENITDWALAQFRAHYGDDSISKWDIFYYVYAALHRPAYRTQFADALKRELPRIPYLADFGGYAQAGRTLAALHLDYETLDPFPLESVIAKDLPLSYRVADKMRLNKDKTALTVNPSLTLRGIPAAAFDYKLGNRSALEWVIDQYQVGHDKAGQVSSDPNRRDDQQYIVRLVGQVIRVSVETSQVVNALIQP